MLQRYKKNRTSASFLLTKCATFLIKCYWGTFSVPSRLTSFLFIVISLKLLDTLLEETKVYATVCALFYKMRMLVEVMCFRVLKNKISAIFQNLLFENQIWNSWQ